MSEVRISKEQLINSYKTADNETKKTLEAIFGKEIFKPKDIKERIKTFEDARSELGSAHPLVEEYETITCRCGGLSDDILAYMKLRIIAAALNEGWEPQFTEDEWRYFPWFVLYTQKEIDEMDEEQKSRVVFRSNSMRVRVAVLRMRARTTIRRARIRTLVLGLPSSQANLRNTLANSLLRFGLITFSSRKKNKGNKQQGRQCRCPINTQVWKKYYSLNIPKRNADRCCPTMRTAWRK